MELKVTMDGGVQHVFTTPVGQYSTGVTLDIEADSMPSPIVYDISNSVNQGNSVRYRADDFPLTVPDGFFLSGEYVNVWVDVYVVRDEEEVLETRMITIPVIRKPVPIEVTSGDSSDDSEDGGEPDEGSEEEETPSGNGNE